MKASLLLVLLALPAFAQSDIRIVGGKEVDLAPVHEYEAAEEKKGERPLKHWKKLEIHSISGQFTTRARCRVTIDRTTREILLANVPTQMSRHFAERQRLESEIKRLTEYVEREGKRLRQLDAATPTSAAGDVAYVDAVMRQRARVNQMIDDLQDEENRLQKFKEALATLEADTAANTDYAMFTGQKYSGLEVWDLGKRKAR